MVKYINALYTGVCDIYEYLPQRRENGTEVLVEQLVQQGVACRLSYTPRISFSGLKNSSADGRVLANAANQQVKLLLNPETVVKTGSKIVVTQNGITQAYKNSGEVAMYRYHQEIVLENFEKWT